MTLADYLRTAKTSEADFATSLGVTQVTVNRYLNGKRFPDKETILRIETITSGKVRPADWYKASERAA